MRYYEAANFLFDLRRFQVKPGTESVRDLLAHLGDPHEGIDFVQVAGSNGKGSVARMVESVLREEGRRVGLYTSPHFEDVRERVRVDGRSIPKAEVAAFVEAAKPWLVGRAADGEPLTFFEVVTALALWRFDRADVDVAVLEVGMGGEYDATSVVDPVAAAVTNVSLEHTAVLGDTVEEIARTKAKVAPAGGPLVTATEGESLATVREVAGDRDADVITVSGPTGGPDPADADLTARYEGAVSPQESRVALVGDGWAVETRIPLLGAYQATNAGVAAALARALDVEDGGTLARGLRNAHWPGRFEVMESEPLVVLDGAHNPAACGTLGETLSELDYDDLHLVFGAMHDKDHAEMAAALPPTATVHTCAPSLDRAEDPEVLARVFERETDAAVTAGDSVADALGAAREAADPDDCVLLTGSLFCVAEARTTWTRQVVPKDLDDEAGARDTLADANVPTPEIDPTARESVHRTVKTRVSESQATTLRREAAGAGVACGVSGVGGGELAEVVLSGSRAEFDALVGALEGLGDGLAGVAADLRGAPDSASASSASAPADDYPWSDGTAVMGVLNVTPDSFHDGGEFFDEADARARAEALAAAGADIVDVGGESTRPGAETVSVEEEIARIEPVIEAIADVDALISVDTRKAAVAEAALDAGADVLNDVTGLEDPEMRFLAAERDVPVIVMHSIDAPVDPESDPDYDDVVEDAIAELGERVLLAEKAGIPRENVIVDPGIGFGKSPRENFAILGRLGEFDALGCPVLFGHSHKRMFELTGETAGDAPHGTVAATALAAANGADIVRVHDAAENVAAVRVAAAAADPEGFDAPRPGDGDGDREENGDGDAEGAGNEDGTGGDGDGEDA
ncbi:dihydropteroate synthase [Halobaculum magnesiiphilum]|uniref:Probable bifunctional folylpolyglutamate synthase/dihydropteroate synthase n=1 Tax=Halobaculum magnesiiphilum TaxID=1017351 RepID=A0A8T8WCU4_9EURY|nr:dihydropteroate synthase [Halobaculum magnesiiphilum]QZP37670.1 dihydropteroate synthase [Halobaculum magnesiiphilum]